MLNLPSRKANFKKYTNKGGNISVKFCRLFFALVSWLMDCILHGLRK